MPTGAQDSDGFPDSLTTKGTPALTDITFLADSAAGNRLKKAVYSTLPFVQKNGDTMTGLLILSGDPVVALGAATKSYVDTFAAGFTIKSPCRVGTTGALTATYANGAAGVGATLTNADTQAALTIDGVALSVNDRVLIKDQASTLENGIYSVTDIGSGATNWVITRATDYDSPAEITMGSLVIVTAGTINAVTSWVQIDTVTTVGVDPIQFTQFSAGVGANTALSNLAAVAINTSLLPGADGTIDLGSAAERWRNGLIEAIQTGTTNGNTTILQAYNTGGATYTTFATLTAGATPTMSLASSVTGTTQAASDNSTKLATTAYADAQVVAIAANKALSNLAAVAVNTALLSAGDNTLNFGSFANRWSDVFATRFQTGHTIGNSYTLSGWDVDGAVSVDFLTVTAANVPTAVLASSVTGTTQAASDNSTKLATTAYVDNQVTTTGANRALSNLSAVAINTSLLPGTDNTIDIGDGTHRTRQIYSAGLTTGTSAGNTLILSARDVDGAINTTFITLTANNTPTCVLASDVTGTTQSAGDNSTKLATTAYADRMVPLAGGTMTGALILNADPTNVLGAATKQYVDAVSSGLDVKTPCYAATTAALNATYLNGAAGVGATLVNAGALAAFSVDGVSPPINSRILVKNQASTFQNGIYTLTTVGTGAVAWVLTRATDYDQAPSEIFPGNFVLINNGTVNTGTGWVQTATVTTIGTDPITFTQFGGSNFAPIDATYIVQTPSSSLTAEQALSALATGILKSTTATGVVSIAAQGTDYYAPGGTDVALADGGTNASLTASNGGIFYSTSTAGAILSGTATARQMLQSGASTTPAWSTTTWPATTTVNRILYSSATSVIGEITTANSGLLVTDGSGVPSIGTAIPNGVTATTQAALDNSTKVATTAYVNSAVTASSPGSLIFIASGTASNSATIDFANNLTSTYDNYVVMIENFCSVNNLVSLQVLVGTGATPTYQVTNYLGAVVSGGTNVASSTSALDISRPSRLNNTSTRVGSFNFNVFNVNNSSNDKTIVCTSTNFDSGGTTEAVAVAGGRWEGATVVTSLRFLISSGNISTGVFRLYGVKNS